MKAAAAKATSSEVAPAVAGEVAPSKPASSKAVPGTPAPRKAVSKKSKKAASPPPVPQPVAAEYAEIHAGLENRLAELQAEYEQTMADLNDLQRDRISDGAGDDQADTGTKTFEREQELSLANGILERKGQVEHALARLDTGTYGQCERCGKAIPKARLEAFPSVTLCVTCKQLEERR
jgi:DnaK suppressor protein